MIPVDDIIVMKKENYRKDLGTEDELWSLAASIEKEGIINPLRVLEGDDGFHLLAGFRRMEAVKLVNKESEVKIEKVPCIVQDARRSNETDALITQILENSHRKDATHLEKARAYKKLIYTCGLTEQEVADRLGSSVSAVKYHLKLLDASPRVLKELEAGNLSAQAVYDLVTKHRAYKEQEAALDGQLHLAAISRDPGSRKTKDRKLGPYRRSRGFRQIQKEIDALRGRRPNGPFADQMDREKESARLKGIRQALAWVAGSPTKPW